MSTGSVVFADGKPIGVLNAPLKITYADNKSEPLEIPKGDAVISGTFTSSDFNMDFLKDLIASSVKEAIDAPKTFGIKPGDKIYDGDDVIGWVVSVDPKTGSMEVSIQLSAPIEYISMDVTITVADPATPEEILAKLLMQPDMLAAREV